jgi:hypothetical protein
LISFDFVAEAFIAVSTSRVVENIRAYSLLVEACPIRHKAAAVPDVPRSSAGTSIGRKRWLHESGYRR